MTTPYTMEPLQIFTKLHQNLKMQDPWLPDQTKPNPDNILLNLTPDQNTNLTTKEIKILTVIYSLKSYEPFYPSIKEIEVISNIMNQPPLTIRKILLQIRGKIKRHIRNKQKKRESDPFELKLTTVGEKIKPKNLNNIDCWTFNPYKIFNTNISQAQVNSTMAKVKHRKQPHNHLPTQIEPTNPNYAQPSNNFNQENFEKRRTNQLRTNLDLTNQEALRINNTAISHARRLQENEKFPGESAGYEFWIYDQIELSKTKCKLNRDGIVIPAEITDELNSIMKQPKTANRDYLQVQRPITPQPSLLDTLYAASGRTGTIDETLEMDDNVGESEFEGFVR